LKPDTPTQAAQELSWPMNAILMFKYPLKTVLQNPVFESNAVIPEITGGTRYSAT